MREQQHRFEQLLGSPELRRARLAADVWCAAFVAEKRPGAEAITQDTLVRALTTGGGALSEAELEVVREARGDYAFLHWHVAFPAVSERGGFDVVLGNPPWEHVKLQEKEFFAARSPEIADRAEQGRTRHADQGTCRGRSSAARRVRGRQARGGRRQPPDPLERALPALRARRRQHVRGLRGAYARSCRPTGRAGASCRPGSRPTTLPSTSFGTLVESRRSSACTTSRMRPVFPAVDQRINSALLTLAGSRRRIASRSSSSSLRRRRGSRRPGAALHAYAPRTSRSSIPNTRTLSGVSHAAATPS